MNSIEFFFDCSSPWTYLAFENLSKNKRNFDIVWKPVLVGGVFNSANPSVYRSRENPVLSKQRYAAKDLSDWSRSIGIDLILPDDLSKFPVNSVKSMRGALVALEEGLIEDYSRLVFEYYWRDDKDISDDGVIENIVEVLGMDKKQFFEKINQSSFKEKLKANTNELVSRGGFGSPTFFLNKIDMYFGNDRINIMLENLAET